MGQSLGGLTLTEHQDTFSRMTGEKRRQLCPIEEHYIPNAPTPTLLGKTCSELKDEVIVSTGMFVPSPSDTTEKHNLFWMTVAPADPKAIKAIVVYHHAFNDHCGWHAQAFMTTLGSLWVPPPPPAPPSNPTTAAAPSSRTATAKPKRRGAAGALPNRHSSSAVKFVRVL
jgi:hypothetical protein